MLQRQGRLHAFGNLQLVESQTRTYRSRTMRGEWTRGMTSRSVTGGALRHGEDLPARPPERHLGRLGEGPAVINKFCANQSVESKTRTYHGRVGVAQGRAAGPGRTGSRRIGSLRRQPSLVPSKASYRPVLNDSSEARTNEITFKPMGEQKPKLPSGLPAARNPLFVTGC